MQLGSDSVTLQPRPRALRDLAVDVWLLLGQGIAIGLLGVWLAVLRPRDPGARMFLIACLGIWVAASSGALYDSRETAAPGEMLWALQFLNLIGSAVSAAGLLGLYMCEPQRLALPWLPPAIIAGAALVAAIVAAGLLPITVFCAELLVLTLGFFAVLAVQWRRSCLDPAGRTALRWVGTATLIGTTCLTLSMAAPQLLGTPPLAGDGMAFVPLLAVYGSIAFGIGPSRLFDLDRWTYRIILGAATALGLLAFDAALIGGLGIDSPVALAVALLAIGFLYMPARTLVWQHIVDRPALAGTELVQTATDVAFAATPAERRDGWRALLGRLFDPLEIRALAEDVAAPEQRGGGTAMAIPATADEAPLLLSYRAGGRKLFGPEQIVNAAEVVRLMRKAEANRDEYARGVDEERQRIARDLHDDVGARLLTSLHRDDVALVRTDVRHAMAEIRTIISSLTGERIALDCVMADLRFETAGRLAAAGIELDWPLHDEPFEPQLLDYSTYKGIVSSHREIVTNIVKHAGATGVSVRVTASATTLDIVVHDNGRGPATSPQAGGHGLANMRQRLQQLHGSLAVVPCDRGMRIEVVVPLA